MDLNVFTEIALEKLAEYLEEEKKDGQSKSNNGNPGRDAD